MKKLLAIVLALAMVMSMSAVAFAGSGSSGGSSTSTPTKAVTTTVTNSDGTTVSTTTEVDGSKGSIATTKDGTQTVEATVSAKAATAADTAAAKAEATETVTVEAAATVDEDVIAYTTPEVTATSDDSTAPVVKVSVSGGKSAAVQLAVKNATVGTVAKVKQADGTYKVVNNCAVGEEGPVVSVSGKQEYIVVENSKEFNDVKADWEKSAAAFVSSREIMQGTGEATFSPEENVTADTVFTVLSRFDGSVSLEQSSGPNWADAGKNWATANGFTADNMDRTTMFSALYKYAGSPAVTAAEKEAAKAQFSDLADLSDAELAAVAFAIKKGITNGVGDGKFGGNETANRVQLGAIVMRYANAIINK